MADEDTTRKRGGWIPIEEGVFAEDDLGRLAPEYGWLDNGVQSGVQTETESQEPKLETPDIG